MRFEPPARSLVPGDITEKTPIRDAGYPMNRVREWYKRLYCNALFTMVSIKHDAGSAYDAYVSYAWLTDAVLPRLAKYGITHGLLDLCLHIRKNP